MKHPKKGLGIYPEVYFWFGVSTTYNCICRRRSRRQGDLVEALLLMREDLDQEMEASAVDNPVIIARALRLEMIICPSSSHDKLATKVKDLVPCLQMKHLVPTLQMKAQTKRVAGRRQKPSRKCKPR